MSFPIQLAFERFYSCFADSQPDYSDYNKVASAIINCKSGSLGCNISVCDDCGHVSVHNNSCRNRHCPCCQIMHKELWIDSRMAETIDCPYFHAVFTIPSELNELILFNKKELYSLMHKASARTLLELASDKKYLGATAGIIQVLHTWGQKLDFHPHIHCIVMGGGLTPDGKFVRSSKDFFIPVKVLSRKFRGKFLALLSDLHSNGKLFVPDSISDWNSFMDSLYNKEWIPFIKETFDGAANAVSYLGRYTHRIAISNSRILEVTDSSVSFRYKDYRDNHTHKVMTLEGTEFIRRFLLHVLPRGFTRIRYYGILSNRTRKDKIAIIRTQTARLKFRSRYNGLSTEERILAMFGIDLRECPCCKSRNYHQIKSFHLRN